MLINGIDIIYLSDWIKFNFDWAKYDWILNTRNISLFFRMYTKRKQG